MTDLSPAAQAVPDEELRRVYSDCLGVGLGAALRDIYNLGIEHGQAGNLKGFLTSSTPPPEPPTVMEILELSGEIEDAGLGQIDLVRAALERWGHA
jgi:hypothetical protein